jgi:hypothetical protein
MSSRAGFNPNPLDLACLCCLLYDHHSNRRIPQFSDVNSRALVGTHWVVDFLAIAFGEVCVSEGAAQLGSFLAFGLHQVRLDKPTYRFGVRAAEIRRADDMRSAASSPPLWLVETETTCRSGEQFDALNVDRLAEAFRGSPARDFLLGFKVVFVQDGERVVVPFAAVGDEEVGGAGEGEPGGASGTGVALVGERAEGRCSEEVSGGMVQCLDREGHRTVRTGVSHPSMCDARTHLDKAVEASATEVWSAPAVGVEGDVDEAGANLLTFLFSEAESFERAWPVAVDDNVGGREQFCERCAVDVEGEVQTGGAFAERDFGNDALVPARRVDAEDIGAEQSEEACRDRPGKDSSQIEDPHSGERSARRARMLPVRAGSEIAPCDERFRGHSDALRAVAPLVGRKHDSSAAPGGDDCRFEFVTVPRRDRGRDTFWRVVCIEGREGSCSVVWGVGM